MAVAARKQVKYMRPSRKSACSSSSMVMPALLISTIPAQSLIVPVGAEVREEAANGGSPQKPGNQRFVRALIPPRLRARLLNEECSNEQPMASNASER